MSIAFLLHFPNLVAEYGPIRSALNSVFFSTYVWLDVDQVRASDPQV